jgi:protoheme IX farnesyltransferase
MDAPARELASVPATATAAAAATPLARAAERAWLYVALTRPRVLSLVLFTAPAAGALGHEDWPAAGPLALVLAGTACVGAGCSALNAWWERERDARMERTKERPLPAGRLAPREALGFGVAISLAGLLALHAAGGALPVALAVATLLHYLLVYTVWLKPRSAWSTVVGGASGAAAPLIADAAFHGAVGAWSVVLFAIVFLWQPPHVWAITLYRRREYEAAGFPVLPVVAGGDAARRAGLAFALALVPVTLLPSLVGPLGAAYGATALAGGGAFLHAIVRALRARSDEADRRVFAVSIVYLAALFAVLSLELFVR